MIFNSKENTDVWIFSKKTVFLLEVILKMRFLSFLCVLLCFFSCNSSHHKEKKQRLTFNTSYEPPTLDPRKVSDNISSYCVRMCYDGLARIGKDEKPVLSLAESYELSEDKKTYTFTLKEAFWSDGSKITASDFEETWKTILRPDFPAPIAYSFYPIANAKLIKEGVLESKDLGVKALDEKTLEVTLEYPSPSFIHLISHCAFYPYPERIAEKNLKFLEDHKKEFVCSGPFHIKEWKTQNNMLFEKNERYFDSNAVKLEEVVLTFVSDQSTELSLYEQNKLDWAGSPFSAIPTDSIATLKKRDDYHTYQITGTYYYVFNTKKFPYNNKNIRKALALAINREELIEHVFQEDYKPATSLVPGIVESKNKHFFKDADSKSANDYFEIGLKELSLTRETFPKITLSYNTEPNIHFRIAQAIQQQWKKELGVESSLQTQEWKVYLDELTKGKFEVARMGATSLYPDAAFFISQFAFERGGFDFSKWHSSEYEGLYLQALQTVDSEKRLEFLNEAEELLMDEMPIAPLFFYTNCYLKQPHVKDVVTDSMNNLELKWAYVEETK